MPIYIDNKKLLFHIQGKDTSYVMQVIKDGYLSHLYWGKRINKYRGSNKMIYVDRVFSPNPNMSDRTFSLDTIPQEYASFGNGDYRLPAYQVETKDGATITDLRFKNYKVYKGKPKLKGLPSIYAEKNDEVTTLEITLTDDLINLEVILKFSILEEFDVISKSVEFKNNGSEDLKLLKALSLSLDFRESDFDLITLYGTHLNEKNISRRKIVPGIQKVESSRGASSPQQAPFLSLVRSNTTEDTGEVFAFNFIYSGNFTAEVQVDSYENTRVGMGINPFNFSWLLKPSETFQTPEAVMVYTSQGLNDMSHKFHNLYMNRLSRGKFRDRLRPILINNWEATYFDFTEDKILRIVEEAKNLGMELFVLDDGWFGKRDNSRTSLGDWTVNEDKLPNGLHSLVENVRSKGMEFGIWFEPEMVSVDSDLYRKHPDWCIQVTNRPHTFGRNQLVLDLSQKEVCDYIIQSISTILSSAAITYVKWDMNRHLTDVGSVNLPSNRQRETEHRYILGLYRILEELNTRFPNVLFENCSSGGGRFDAGMLYYMPQTWTSDNTDAISRLKIQYGTSIVYPPLTMGAHVSSVPNHQVGRSTPLDTRAQVAMSGNLGYELDLTSLSIEEKNELIKQIDYYKEIRSTIQFGTFYRILSPFESNEAAWCFVSKDQAEVVVNYFKILSQPSSPIKTLKIKGLNKRYLYKNRYTNEVFGGDELMNAGISLPIKNHDFSATTFHFIKYNSED
ncbi:alpha-galactosidase [Oceanobacillus oncorhynchi]|uniref:alpha-galactosidase n=1 Tax=Oceanobacillus oncorhynchi TaxID=545501 RepID=UPI002115F5D8|nr:alpha-galactosidase [Oceanobacillus oncorhynchi]UUI40628.1 alpha-galactosidase [Oceanobacillus oncorhynchi]